MVRHWTAICAGAALAALVWWPTDAWLYAEVPDVRAAMGRWRIGVIVCNVVLLVASRSPWLRGHVEWVVGLALAAQVGWIAACVGPERYHFMYPAPVFTIALVVPLRARVGWALLCSATTWLAAHPSGRAATLAGWEHLSFMLFTTALGIGIGHLVHQLALSQFLLRRHLAAQQAELAALTASLEERVAEQATHLLDLHRRAAGTRLAERARIARDLHDGLGQELTGARLVAQALLAGTLPESVRAGLSELTASLARSHQSLRQALDDLTPSALEEHGLVVAIRGMVEAAGRRSGLRVELALEPMPADLSPPVAVAAFRVAQEALSNVVQHASASAVRVGLRVDAEQLVLDIADDGVGLASAPASARSRFGLLGIRARVRELGGEVSLRGDAGTTVTVVLPLRGGPR